MRWGDSAVLLPDGTMSYHSEHWDFFDARSGGFKDMPEAQVETGAVRSGGIFRDNEGQLGASFDIAKNQPLTREQLRFIKNAIKETDKVFIDIDTDKGSYVIENNKVQTLRGSPAKNIGELYKVIETETKMADEPRPPEQSNLPAVLEAASAASQLLGPRDEPRPKGKLQGGIGALRKAPWFALARMAWNELSPDQRQVAEDYAKQAYGSLEVGSGTGIPRG